MRTVATFSIEGRVSRDVPINLPSEAVHDIIGFEMKHTFMRLSLSRKEEERNRGTLTKGEHQKNSTPLLCLCPQVVI